MKIALGVVAISLAFVSAASAKDFGPGDLNICNARHCLPLEHATAAKQLGSFYYGPREPVRTAAPRLGVAYFELRFGNGYVTGIVATVHLDRFLSYGVNLNQFRRRQWYRVPSRAARELRRLMNGLEPLTLSPRALARSR